jgi:hypothetical protein
LQEIAIAIPEGCDCADIEAAIDRAIVEAGLSVSLRATLKSFPGSVHWHAKSGRASGTLEVTLWPREHRAWFTIQDGRKASWIACKLKSIGDAIRRQLA